MEGSSTNKKNAITHTHTKFVFGLSRCIVVSRPPPPPPSSVPRVAQLFPVSVPGQGRRVSSWEGGESSPGSVQQLTTGHDSCFRSYFHVFHLASPPLSASAHRNGSYHKRAGFCSASCPADTFLSPWRARRTPVPGIQHTGAHTATGSSLCSRLPPNTPAENGNKK